MVMVKGSFQKMFSMKNALKPRLAVAGKRLKGQYKADRQAHWPTAQNPGQSRTVQSEKYRSFHEKTPSEVI